MSNKKQKTKRTKKNLIINKKRKQTRRGGRYQYQQPLPQIRRPITHGEMDIDIITLATIIRNIRDRLPIDTTVDSSLLTREEMNLARSVIQMSNDEMNIAHTRPRSINRSRDYLRGYRLSNDNSDSPSNEPLNSNELRDLGF